MFERRKLDQAEPAYAKYGPNFCPHDWNGMIIANSEFDELVIEEGEWAANNFWLLLINDYLARGYRDTEFQALADDARRELEMFRLEAEMETELVDVL